MAAPKKIICPSCGFKNSAPLPNNRCVSCGAKIEDLKRAMSRQDELERRYQQEGFSVGWFVISIVVMGVLTAAIAMYVFGGTIGAAIFQLLIPQYLGQAVDTAHRLGIDRVVGVDGVDRREVQGDSQSAAWIAGPDGRAVSVRGTR